MGYPAAVAAVVVAVVVAAVVVVVVLVSVYCSPEGSQFVILFQLEFVRILGILNGRTIYAF